MVSTEKNVKSQFEKVFVACDWRLFKKFAESNLQEAAALLTSDMVFAGRQKLLARNSRKRLLIGVGVEILLKAICLKHGYAINTHKSRQGNPPSFPFLLEGFDLSLLALDNTVKFDDLINNLHRVVTLQNSELTLKGLKIAKVFRNKEGHAVTAAHVFDPSNYKDVAASLVELYRDAFAERLVVQFSLAPNELCVWRRQSLPQA
jgi:hypothetical protein